MIPWRAYLESNTRTASKSHSIEYVEGAGLYNTDKNIADSWVLKSAQWLY
jgi:hypothetical protein